MMRLQPHTGRRGLTLAEAMIAIAIGAVLSVVAYSLIDQMRGATQRLDYRIGVVGDSDEAILAIERELDYMVPLGWPAIDFSLERWERDRIRFFSSRELQKGGEIALVEIRLDPDDPSTRRPRAVGTADAAMNADRLVLEFYSPQGEPTGRTDTLLAFRRNAHSSLTFEAELDAPDARPEPGSALVLRLVRPASVTAVMAVRPLVTTFRGGDDEEAAGVDAAVQRNSVTHRNTWSLTRKGGGA